MAVFPQPVESNNPYQRLLHDALARHGVRVLPRGPLGPAFARAADRSVDAVHLHWIEPLLRTYPVRWKDALPAHVKGLRVLTALAMLRRRRARVVWTVHNLRPHEPRFPRLERRVTRAMLRTADALIVHSAYAGRQAVATLGWSGPVHVVPHGNYIGVYPPEGRSRAELRAALGLPEHAFVYLVFGRVRAYKQVADVVEAFGDAHPDSHLVVAGWPHRGQEAVLRAAADGNERVHLNLADIPAGEVAGYHLAADAVVLNYREVFSSGALLLALSFGVPVVAPAEGTATEIASRPAIEPFTPGGLAGALRAVREGDPERRRQAALAAAESCSWERAAELTVEAYGLR